MAAVHGLISIRHLCIQPRVLCPSLLLRSGQATGCSVTQGRSAAAPQRFHKPAAFHVKWRRVQKTNKTTSIHPSSKAYLESALEGNTLSREAQTSLAPVTSSSSPSGTTRRSQASQETRNTSPGRHPKEMHEPPQLAPPTVKERSQLLPGN